MSVHVGRANRAWEALMQAHTSVLREFAADPMWREHGLSMREYDVLYALAKLERGGGPVRIGDVQQGVLLSQPALSRMVDRLVERGLIERASDETDRRAVCVRLSEAGRELRDSLGRAHARDVARVVGGALDDDELQELERLTAKLAAASA